MTPAVHSTFDTDGAPIDGETPDFRTVIDQRNHWLEGGELNAIAEQEETAISLESYARVIDFLLVHTQQPESVARRTLLLGNCVKAPSAPKTQRALADLLQVSPALVNKLVGQFHREVVALPASAAVTAPGSGHDCPFDSESDPRQYGVRDDSDEEPDAGTRLGSGRGSPTGTRLQAAGCERGFGALRGAGFAARLRAASLGILLRCGVVLRELWYPVWVPPYGPGRGPDKQARPQCRNPRGQSGRPQRVQSVHHHRAHAALAAGYHGTSGVEPMAGG